MKMDKLVWEVDWQETIDEMEPGSTARINHEKCPAGEDTRRRLYFTKPAAGDVVLGYCHNCQMGGRFHAESYRENEFNTGEILKTDEWKDIEDTVSFDIKEWPQVAREAVFKYLTSQVLIQEYGIGYDPHLSLIHI